MAGYVGNVPVPQSVREDQSFTATAGQTTFNTLGYTDGNRIKVTLNGVLLEGGGVDYTATNGSDVVLTVAAVVDDIVRFETFNEVQLVSNTSTTPIIKTNLTLKNDTHEDTDGGRESTVIFSGEQSGGEITTLAEIEASHDGTADDQKGDLIFRTNDGNDGTSPTERLRINSGGDMLFSSEDPSLTLANTTHEDSDGGRESTIVFQGEQSGGEVSTLAQIEAAHDGTADDEKGDLIFRTNDGSDGTSPTTAMTIDSAQNVGIQKTPNTWRTTDVALQLGDSTSQYANLVSGGTGVTFGAGWYRDGVSNNFKYTHSATTAGRYDYNYTASNVFSWHQAAAGTAGNNITFTEIMRADEDGLKFNGDTAATNALDDYEEGTWSPGVNHGSMSVAGAVYTKVGNLVTVTANVYNFSDRSSSNSVGINNLPYTSASSGTATGSIIGRYIGHSGVGYSAYIGSSSGSVYFYENPHTADYHTMKHSDFATSSSADFHFSITYRT